MFELKTNFYYPAGPDYGDISDAPVNPEEPTATTKKVEPRTREEHYLAAIAGEDVTVPEPRTRQEHYLKEIAENSGSSGGGILICHIDAQTRALDKTWQEIFSAPFAVVLQEDEKEQDVIRTYYPISEIHSADGTYTVSWRTQEDTQTASTLFPEDYPALP